MQDELLQLMKNFKLCYEIPNCPDSFIAPQLLSLEQPEYDWDSDHNLMLRFEYDFMPKGILTRFIVEKHDWIDCQTCVWKNGVILDQDQQNHTKAEVIETYRAHKGHISIRVSGKRKRELLTIIRYELEKIHRSYERLKYSPLIPCNCKTCKGSQTPHFYKFEILRKFLDDRQTTIQCQTSYQMVNVRSLIDDVMDKNVQPDSKHNNQYPDEMASQKLDMASQTSPSPRVLISYSHDSEPHRKRVLELTNQLRTDGVDCRIDRYMSNPSEGWPLWMDNQVEESDFVLIVFTERYTERSKEKRKSGVRFESVLMLQELYDAGMINDKFIPVLFHQDDSQHIHKWLKPYSYYSLEGESGYDSLLRRLIDDHDVKMPPLGTPTKKGPIQP